MTAFLHSFWIFVQIGFASKWNLMSSFGKVSQPICTDCFKASLRYCSKSEIYGTWFPVFSYSRPLFCQIDVFLGLVACGHVQEFNDIFLETENVGQTISDPGQKLIVYTLPSMWQYPFFQNDIKWLYFVITVKTRNSVFCCIVLPIGIAYCPLLFRCGITAPCFSGVDGIPL